MYLIPQCTRKRRGLYLLWFLDIFRTKTGQNFPLPTGEDHNTRRPFGRQIQRLPRQSVYRLLREAGEKVLQRLPGDLQDAVLTVQVLLREFAVSGMRLIAVEKGRVIAAGWSGKVKTASTMVCICLMLFGIPHWLNLVCQGVILVTTVYSGVEYFAKNWDVFQENK